MWKYKVFDSKRIVSQISGESKKMDNQLTEGAKLFEDYLKRNSLLSKASSIQKTMSVNEIIKTNPHFLNTNNVFTLTETKSKKRNSLGSVIPNITGPQPQSLVQSQVSEKNTPNNTATKSNKSSKSTKKEVFDMYLDMEKPMEFENYFPKNNIGFVVKMSQVGHKKGISGMTNTSQFSHKSKNLKKVRSTHLMTNHYEKREGELGVAGKSHFHHSKKNRRNDKIKENKTEEAELNN